MKCAIFHTFPLTPQLLKNKQSDHSCPLLGREERTRIDSGRFASYVSESCSNHGFV
jgi:hypothetical protein